MSDGNPSDLVIAHLAAFTSGDLTELLATLAADAVFVSGTTLITPSDFAEFFGWAIREIQPRIRLQSVVSEAGNVACQFVETVTVEGQQRQLNRAAFYTVADGLISSVKVYGVHSGDCGQPLRLIP